MERKLKIRDLFDSKLKQSRPYWIAEAGVNHEGSLDTAIQMVIAAKHAGADAIKFQFYKAEKIASSDAKSYWDRNEEPSENQVELFQKYDNFSAQDFQKIAIECKRKNIEFLCTPFDLDGADFLNELVPAFKISSSDFNNYPLIKRVKSKNKPIILSTGATTQKELEQFRIQYGVDNTILLHCVLNYPTKNENANLSMISELKRMFKNSLVGYSDHTIASPRGACFLASGLGACVIEKHFSLDKTLKGNDHYHSATPEDLKELITESEIAWSMRGNGLLDIENVQLEARQQARRSIYAAVDIEKGKKISEEMLIMLRPGTGLPPTEIDNVVGRIAKQDIPAKIQISESYLEFKN